MMELSGWYQMISYSITNGIRIFLCLLLVRVLLKLPKGLGSAVWQSVVWGIAAAFMLNIRITPGGRHSLSATPVSQAGVLIFEGICILFVLFMQYRCELRMCAFIIFFFEIAAALWEFLMAAGLAVMSGNAVFLDSMTCEGLVPVWIVRFFMIGLAVFIFAEQGKGTEKRLERTASMIAVAGMTGAVMLTEQSVIPLPEDRVMTWIILSVILIMAVLFYRMNRQYETEKEMVRLKEEHAQALEQDYQRLNNAYSSNARLYHDLHNHIEALYSYLSRGQEDKAMQYMEELRTSAGKITSCNWTGDEAVDYLIGSKIAEAERAGIETRINIEFPAHTNIRSADLTAILGNLLDNALEALKASEEREGFLHLAIRRVNEMLIIKVENSCSGGPDFDGEEIKTTKTEGGLHGWGIKSARTAAERYEGTLEVSCGNGVFCAVAILSFEAV